MIEPFKVLKIKRTVTRNTSFFANKLLARRLQLNMTQRNLAEALNLSRSTIAIYELCRATPSMEKFIHICAVLQLTPNELLGWD